MSEYIKPFTIALKFLFNTAITEKLPMANDQSQAQFGGCHQDEDTAIIDFRVALENSVDFQESLQPQVQPENLPDSFPARNIQASGTWTLTTGTGPCEFVRPRLILLTRTNRSQQDNQLPEARDCPTRNQTSPCFSMIGVMPNLHTDSWLGSEIIAADSEIAPNYATLQANSKAYYDSSSQGFLLSRNPESQQQLMGWELSSEHSQLNDFLSTSFGVEDMQQVPAMLPGSSQIQNQLDRGIHTDFHSGFPSFPMADPAQSSSFSSSQFNISATATSGFNFNFNVDNNPFNRNTCENMDIEWNTEISLGRTLMTEPSTNPVQELGSSENPVEIRESKGNAPKSQLLPAIIDEKRSFPRTFGPSRPVVLPPARRGGRKGPRSALELKNLRESRKQGVCIRCRKMKEKVATI